MPFILRETATSECPVSMASSNTEDILEQFVRVKIMKEFGAVPYGGDLNKFPAKLVDAFAILQAEHAKVESLKLGRKHKRPQ